MDGIAAVFITDLRYGLLPAPPQVPPTLPETPFRQSDSCLLFFSLQQAVEGGRNVRIGLPDAFLPAINVLM